MADEVNVDLDFSEFSIPSEDLMQQIAALLRKLNINTKKSLTDLLDDEEVEDDIHLENVIGRVVRMAPPARFDEDEQCIVPGVGTMQFQKCQNFRDDNDQRRIMWKSRHGNRPFYNFCEHSVRPWQSPPCDFPSIPNATEPPDRVPTYGYFSQDVECCKFMGFTCPPTGNVGDCVLLSELDICETLSVAINGVQNQPIDPVTGEPWEDTNITPCGFCDDCEDWNQDFELKLLPIPSSIQGPVGSRCETCYFFGKQRGTTYQNLIDSGFQYSGLLSSIPDPQARQCLADLDFPCGSAGDISFMLLELRICEYIAPCCPGGRVYTVQLANEDFRFKNCPLPVTHAFPGEVIAPPTGDILIESVATCGIWSPDSTTANTETPCDEDLNQGGVGTACWRPPNIFRQSDGLLLPFQAYGCCNTTADPEICFTQADLRAAVAGSILCVDNTDPQNPVVTDLQLVSVVAETNVAAGYPQFNGDNELCFQPDDPDVEMTWTVELSCVGDSGNTFTTNWSSSSAPLGQATGQATYAFGIDMCQWAICKPVQVVLHRC